MVAVCRPRPETAVVVDRHGHDVAPQQNRVHTTIAGLRERVFVERTFEIVAAKYPGDVNPVWPKNLERMFAVQVFDSAPERPYDVRMAPKISTRQRDILDFIDPQMRDRGYPPSVREIGDAVGLTSPSTVHSHLNTLQRLGYLRRDPTKPRAIEVRYDANSGAIMERRPVRHVPLVGDVAAGTDVLAEENVEELLPVPVDFAGEGELFMLRVRGESMIDVGILDGDYVVATQIDHPNNGDIVVAGIPAARRRSRPTAGPGPRSR